MANQTLKMSLTQLITTTTQLAAKSPEKWGGFLEALKELQTNARTPLNCNLLEAVFNVSELFRLSNEALDSEELDKVKDTLFALRYTSKLKCSTTKAMTAAREISKLSSGLVIPDAILLIVTPLFND